MPENPTPEEAARALHDVERRKGQAIESAGVALWVRVVFGLAIFVSLAAPDFFGSHIAAYTSWLLTLIAVAYVIMLNSRRGSAVLGQPTRLRRDEIRPRFAVTMRVILLVILAIGIVVAFVPHGQLDVPYLRTIVGAVLGIALIIFGDRSQRAMNTYARRNHAEPKIDGEGTGGTR